MNNNVRLQYFPKDGAITAHNGLNEPNRPLYMKDGIMEVIYTGDAPGVGISKTPIYWEPAEQQFIIKIICGSHSKVTSAFDAYEVRHRPNRTHYTFADGLFPGVIFQLEVYPLNQGYGFAVCLAAFGTTDESVRAEFILKAPAGSYHCLFETGQTEITESEIVHRATLKNGEKIHGAVSLKYQAIHEEAFQADPYFTGKTAEEICRLSRARCEDLEKRVQVSSCDEYFDTAVPFLGSALDGMFIAEPPIIYHGGTGWRMKLLGWKTMPGFIYLGWHERVCASISYYLGLQNKDNAGASEGAVPDDSASIRRTRQTLGSRMFGKGYIGQPENECAFYNMQTQFFDAAIDEWRATGNKELERPLLEGLKLHLERAKVCFDPDDDGLYESYINVLPTDSIQYNGGGTVEESSYIYRANIAAAELCGRFGEARLQKQYLLEGEKIHYALTHLLYMEEEGYMAGWREQNPPHRLHKDAWLCSELLPVIHGVLCGHKAVSALFYTEWALERLNLPCGGCMTWNSNWVPQKWSTRWLYSADNYALAEAYFRTGLGDAGWELMSGNLRQSNFCLEGAADAISPGSFSYGGKEENLPCYACADGSDITNSFAPAMVCGLFGYHPDYPNGQVEIAPAFPSDWKDAALSTEDFSIRYHQNDYEDHYFVQLKQSADIKLKLQIRAEGVEGVSVNNRAVDYQIVPWYECTLLVFSGGRSDSFEVKITLSRRNCLSKIGMEEYEIGETVLVEGSCLEDPQHGFEMSQKHEGRVELRSVKSGYYTLFALQNIGALPVYRIYKFHIKDSRAEQLLAYRTPSQYMGGKLTHIDLSEHFTASIEDIFRQKYLSPRNNTCSARIGTDGYSNWTYLAWGKQPPEIRFHVPSNRMIQADTGVTFACGDKEKNIIFTSVWDNWATKAEVSIGKPADVAWVLICGSTNCMQGKIENARLEYVYEDGTRETLPLIHPQNFWTLAHTCGVDYDYELAGFPLPKVPPKQVQLGENCRAMVLSMRLNSAKILEKITLECISEDVIVGIMGITLERY